MTNQELNTHQIKVIGHCNPDTDSICSAIAYSRLKKYDRPRPPLQTPAGPVFSTGRPSLSSIILTYPRRSSTPTCAPKSGRGHPPHGGRGRRDEPAQRLGHHA